LDRWGKRIAIAWAVGFLASAVGLIASYQVDFPSGPAIVCSLGALPAAVRGVAGAAAKPPVRVLFTERKSATAPGAGVIEGPPSPVRHRSGEGLERGVATPF
jgi:hypothetical protein